jgi:hypothetical protein
MLSANIQTAMPSMPKQYTYDKDYKTLYEQAIERLGKYEKKENEKKNKKDKTNEDENQYKNLYQEILKQNDEIKKNHEKDNIENKKIINNLNDTIKKLNEKLDKLSIDNKNNIPVTQTKEYKDLTKELNEVKNKSITTIDENKIKHDIETKLQNEYETKQKLVDESFKSEMKKQETKFKEELDKLKLNHKEELKKAKAENKISGSSEKNHHGSSRDKSKPILERYTFKPFNITDKDTNNDEEVKKILEYANYEETFRAKFQSELVEKANNSDKLINLIVLKRLEFEEKSKSDSSKTRMKNKIVRCAYLFNKYKDRLSRFRFYISHIEEMSQLNWNKWIVEIDKIVNEYFKDNEGCQFEYQRDSKSRKAGEKCRWINCPYPHHKSEHMK